ncbi:hypothetical protein TOPH_09119, partial [Tolypocladium ophioglossoides CBS 100239]
MREVYTPRSILVYQSFASLTLVVSIYVSICFAVIKPNNDAAAYRFGYIDHFYSKNSYYKHEATSIAAYFISHNFLHTTFVLLFAYSCFSLAEVILILNFVNLSSLYFCYNCPLSVHIPVITKPTSCRP